MPRPIVFPFLRQAVAREAFMANLQATPRYRNIVIQDLRPLWKAVTVTVDPRTPLATLEEIQRGPHDGERKHALQETWGVSPSSALGTYLDTRDARITAVLHLSEHATVPLWVRQDLHSETAELEPCSRWERIDMERMVPEHPTPEWEIRVPISTTGARVVVVDGRSGESSVLQELRPAGPSHAFDDFDALQQAIAAAVQDVAATFTRYYAQANWLKNAPSESRLVHDDIPALVRWYVADARPPDDATRRRLSRLARAMLDLTPPRAGKTRRKNSPKSGAFFARLSAEPD